jgi:hypothetical protein
VTEETTAFANAMIFDGVSDELREGCVRVTAGVIAEVANNPEPGDRVIDCRGGRYETRAFSRVVKARQVAAGKAGWGAPVRSKCFVGPSGRPPAPQLSQVPALPAGCRRARSVSGGDKGSLSR